MKAMTILFLHGWNSIPGGIKPTYLKDDGHTVLNPAQPDDDFDESIVGRASCTPNDNRHAAGHTERPFDK